MDINDLPDLSDWRYIEVWTVEEAALLWAAIDPMEHENLRLSEIKKFVRLVQYKKAGTFQRAIVEAVCGGTLPFSYATELITDIQNYGEWEKEVEFPNLPDSRKLIPHKTKVTQAAFMKWVKGKNMPSYREFVIKNSPNIITTNTECPTETISEILFPVSTTQVIPLTHGYLDSANPCSPQELRAASDAWNAITDGGDPRESGAAVKAAIRKYLDEHPEYNSLSNEAKVRVCTVSNWNKKGGPPKTPN